LVNKNQAFLKVNKIQNLNQILKMRVEVDRAKIVAQAKKIASKKVA